MTVIRRLLIANRGEIAIRIARGAGEMGIETVAIYSADDARSLHVRAADSARLLSGVGPAAYLAIDAIVAAARDSGCDAVHSGYGFLSESAAFARACAAAGLLFVGPSPEALALFGDKVRAKRFAGEHGVPVCDGIDSGDVQAAQAFLAALPPGSAVMVKAAGGGGGRGMRLVSDGTSLPAAMAACAAEVGTDAGVVLVERFIGNARHIEIQVLADGTGAVTTLGERDCSVQRRNQKLLEIAPAPGLAPELRERITEAARTLIRAADYRGLATVEFLVDQGLLPGSDGAFMFIEVNPRLQVEHTVTEEISGVDLVQTSLRLAAGESLEGLGLSTSPPNQGCALQLRISAEILDAWGQSVPSTGTLTAYDPPSGPGIRVDGAGYAGYAVNPRFDPLLAKVIVRADDFASATKRAARALADFRITGVETTAAVLGAVLRHPDFVAGAIDTQWLARHLPDLLAGAPSAPRYFEPEPLREAAAREFEQTPPGTEAVLAPLTGIVVHLDVALGDTVRLGQQVAVLEALKMQYLVTATTAGTVHAVCRAVGDMVDIGAALLFVEPGDVDGCEAVAEVAADLDHRRPDLADLDARIALTLDSQRPDAVARRVRTNQRTARENLDDLFDAGSFLEYGALAIASGRRGMTEELMRDTPGDGIVTGIGTVNAADFGEDAAACAGLAYDYTVIAGTQGRINHAKTDRLIEVIHRHKLPVVFFCEGGGGRPGDGSIGRDTTGLAVESFRNFAALAGRAPRIGIASGRCFAGNAVFLGSCDLIIATENAKIGLAGPAMIEGGGLGRFHADEIGPIDVQWANGGVDVRVQDEAQATAAAKTILSYFQGRAAGAQCGDQRELRTVVPENRLRVFDIRRAIVLIADLDSWTELRAGFALGMITGFVRIDGRPMGLIANDCRHLSGAIDADGCAKATDFLKLCNTFNIPILSLCDTPGFMVGPDAERQGTVRRGGEMFIAAAALRVNIFTVVIRKGYGLGAMAMAGGSLHAGAFTVAWPTGEFGGMGLEGAARLGHKRELEAIADAVEREVRFQQIVTSLYDNGKAAAVAQFIDIDAVIDPSETRRWLKQSMSAERRSGS